MPASFMKWSLGLWPRYLITWAGLSFLSLAGLIVAGGEDPHTAIYLLPWLCLDSLPWAASAACAIRAGESRDEFLGWTSLGVKPSRLAFGAVITATVFSVIALPLLWTAPISAKIPLGRPESRTAVIFGDVLWAAARENNAWKVIAAAAWWNDVPGYPKRAPSSETFQAAASNKRTVSLSMLLFAESESCRKELAARIGKIVIPPLLALIATLLGFRLGTARGTAWSLVLTAIYSLGIEIWRL